MSLLRDAEYLAQLQACNNQPQAVRQTLYNQVVRICQTPCWKEPDKIAELDNLTNIAMTNPVWLKMLEVVILQLFTAPIKKK